MYKKYVKKKIEKQNIIYIEESLKVSNFKKKELRNICSYLNCLT